jgi:hypothetical protein
MRAPNDSLIFLVFASLLHVLLYSFVANERKGKEGKNRRKTEKFTKEKVIPNDFGFQNDEEREEDDAQTCLTHDDEKQEQEMTTQKRRGQEMYIHGTPKRFADFLLRSS